MQKTDTDSHKKFPYKSCPLRYGTSKIQEDALLLFQAGLREYLGSYQPKTSGGPHDGWGIIGLSVSASKIVAIPSVSLPHISFLFLGLRNMYGLMSRERISMTSIAELFAFLHGMKEPLAIKSRLLRSIWSFYLAV